ncbi:MAG: serine/threonine-protein kinase [Terricaulis sp.]|nr:serine/threonine-protein kinase [Terricaulis sp.]
MSQGETRALAEGQPLMTVNGRPGRVGALLGAGGQGEVYHVTVEGLPFALKWYHRHYIDLDIGLRTRLERTIRRGAPTPDFLWPLDLVEIHGSGSFGYVMPLRSDDFRGMRDLIAAPPQRLNLTLADRASVCLQLANSFLELHAGGFCYQDINFGNIFLHPENARILICDNDNVNIDGADASIYGARKFMAPEVVRREMLPNSRTDLFSMAVLFFYTLLGWHPLDGKREHAAALLDPDTEHRLYGAEPLFIFDPHNGANGPVRNFHEPIVARWNSLNGELRALFIRSFGEGLHDPHARVLETEWRAPLQAVIDAAFGCADCQYEHVADWRAGKMLAPMACLACGKAITAPEGLRVGRRVIGLSRGKSVPGDALGLRAGAAALVEAHPARPEITGLRNLSDTPWQATLPGGESHTVEAGQAVRILPGLGINFGKLTGAVLAAKLEQNA